ncbi:ATP-binding protein [Hoylesella timonensis]|uniref:ATP-binding protein n=1 Tax=Hoylesella timonensis TaxID=386414 RepID=A0A2K0XKT2_9BACT|nr:ABC transporter ATP-binding protein [Hoylesella timonensis]PNP95144.1 ATP-binding protein [Hoylesella timonensis]
MKIQLTGLKKIFGEKTAVNIPSLEIDKGEVIGLVGNNGAGKTTLFRLLLDLQKADEGQVLLGFDEKETKQTVSTEPITSAQDSTNLTWIAPSETEVWKALTGAYIDSGFLIDFLTPEEYFDFIAKVNHLPTEQLQSFLNSMAQLMDGEILEQKKLIRDFSAGNQQKIGIIAAMIAHPQLLILDEPFNFLDPSSQNLLKKIILDYHKQTNATILVSSHNLQHTIEISTRVILLEKGKIIKDLPNENQKAEADLEAYFNRDMSNE